MKIRQLCKSDIASIIELEKHHAPDKPHYVRYDQKTLLFIFDNPDDCGAIGLFDKERLVGWGAYRTNWSKYNAECGVYEISSIVVDTTYRRQGLGERILNRIIDDLKKKKFTKVYLTVSPLNLGALILYVKNGFIIYDYKANVYGEGADRVFLKLAG
ncbi:GNAT family N-acetyltransferase [bacterium]|nr:GNAT family N-acetyltransferase [bacterium]